jgi:hypothetical protein
VISRCVIFSQSQSVSLSPRTFLNWLRSTSASGGVLCSEGRGGGHVLCCAGWVLGDGAGSEAAAGGVVAAPAARSGRNGRVDLWPMPASVTRGAQTLHVSRDLKLTTAGSNYSDGQGIFRDAVARMMAVVEMEHVVNGSYHGAPVLAGVNVVVRSPDDKVRGYAQ